MNTAICSQHNEREGSRVCVEGHNESEKKLLEIEQEILSQNEGLRQEIRMLQAFKVLKRDQHFDL